MYPTQDGLIVLDLPPHQAWADDALCAQTDPELFYPEKGGPNRAARRICSHCPVTDQCLAYAMEHEEMFGIWGGVSARDRRKRLGRTQQGAA